MELDIESRSTLESRVASDNRSEIHDNPKEVVTPFHSQQWDDRFMSLSSTGFGPVADGHSFNTCESAMETFPPPASPTIWDTQPPLYDSYSEPVVETSHGHAKQTTPNYQNTHSSVVQPDNWDMVTSSYPQSTHLLTPESSVTVHAVSTAEVDHPYPSRVGDCIEQFGFTMDDNGSHSTAHHPKMTSSQCVKVQSFQTNTNLNLINEGRSALYDLSALPTRASALSMSSEPQQPSSSPAEDLGYTSRDVLH
jgi:hypothetical protein